MHLTDQASVAVRVARSLGGSGGARANVAPGGARANVAHLVAGLAGEPEGLAGTLLRQRFGELAPRIALHPSVAARALPSISTAFVALPVTDRPCWTLELLQAARRVGGEDLEHLLAECGAGLRDYADELDHHVVGPDQADERTEDPETFGRWSLLDRGFTRDADLAVARTRATAGTSRTLLGWLAPDEVTANALASAPDVPLDAVVERAAAGSAPIGMSDLITAVTHLSLQASLRR